MILFKEKNTHASLAVGVRILFNDGDLHAAVGTLDGRGEAAKPRANNEHA